MNYYNIYYPSFDNLQRSNRRSAPILYVIASKRYQKGVLTETLSNIATSNDLWKEIITKTSIRNVLQDWIKTNKLNINISNMTPFRMTLHQLNRCKIGIIKTFTNKQTSINQFDENNKSKFFALIWVPMLNTKTGFTQTQYQNLIDAFNQSNYICKPLNKDCIYISGPKYNHNEFDVTNLATKCHNLCAKDNILQFKYTVIIHEMRVGDTRDMNNKIIKPFTPQMKHYNFSVTEEDEIDPAMEAFTIGSMNELQQITTEHKLASTINLGSVTNILNNISEEEDENDENDDYKEKEQLEHQSGKSYAFPQSEAIYFEHPIPRNRQLSEIKVNSTHAYIPHTMIDSYQCFGFIWITPQNNNNNNKYSQRLMTLPSYCIMKTLHKEPTESNFEILYNIELMAYDNCWDDLDLVIDRKFDIYGCLLLILQFIFLPIFILFPIQYCLNPKIKNNMKPRYRPDNATFEELDITEQIPYDISRLWKNNKYFICKNKILFRLISFIISCCVYFIICFGAIFYHLFDIKTHSENIDNLNKLQFFDCYGPLLFYILLIFTIIIWSVQTRILIGPKQHILLYDKLFIHRPVSKRYRVTPRSDWGALVNLHEPMSITLYTYAYKKGFLQLQTATNKLINKSFLCNYKFNFKCICAIILYLFATNLENFEFAHRPFYIGKQNKYWLLLTIYNIFSAIIQSVFLYCFILIWETMIFRTYCHFDNIRDLSHLIIRDTKTEYISLDYINNILSWLSLETFVKRKGMQLFSSVETPLLSLFILCFISWASTFYCIVQGVGLKLHTNDSMFSNSALITWIYLGILALLYTIRMIISGHLYYRETVKQSQAIKRQCRRENKNNLINFLNKDKLSIEQYLAQQSCELLLQHIEHTEIVPKVYGIQFDQLFAKAFITAAVSILPTIASFLASRITQPQH